MKPLSKINETTQCTSFEVKRLHILITIYLNYFGHHGSWFFGALPWTKIYLNEQNIELAFSAIATKLMKNIEWTC